MTQTLHGHSSHFAALLEHLSAFDERQRRELADLYDANSPEPVDIAKRWCQQPQQFDDVLDRELQGTVAWEVIEHLAQEHDLPVDIHWIDPNSRKALTRVGILKPSGDQLGESDVDWIPAAVAAILAPRLTGVRPTLPVLLGRRSHEEVIAIAEQWAISAEGSRIELILRISEEFAQPEFIDSVLSRLPHPDWITGAMMTLELGGICYWREIFGHELEDKRGEDNVVPLMRSDERDEQRQNASLLLELGVIFKVEEEGAEFPLVAVPEELWFGLWSVGQSWLVDWTALTFGDLEDVAVRQAHEPRAWDAQKVLRWLTCEARSERLGAEEDALADDALEELQAKADDLDIAWGPAIDLAFDLEVLEERDELAFASRSVFALLDMPRTSFVREVLSVWALGIIGTGSDRELPQAMGLDEEWVEHLVDIFGERSERLSPWMTYPGVPHVETGAGCLREIEDGDEEFMLLELGLTNTCLCLTKVHWLDLLSLLEDDEWYSAQGLRDLLQMAASFAIFSQLGHIIQDPHSNYYFPVQRPSFLTLPSHTEAFDGWLEDIVTHLLDPLGVAKFSDDGERVWLDTRLLRVPSPPDWPEEPRLQLVREVLGDPEFEFVVPESKATPLHTVPEFNDEDRVPIDLPMETLIQVCEGREIVGFDGKALLLG